jgi:hypothetical protein
VETTLGLMSILGRLGMQKLAEARLNQVYGSVHLPKSSATWQTRPGYRPEMSRQARLTLTSSFTNLEACCAASRLAQREGLEPYFDPRTAW